MRSNAGMLTETMSTLLTAATTLMHDAQVSLTRLVSFWLLSASNIKTQLINEITNNEKRKSNRVSPFLSVLFFFSPSPDTYLRPGTLWPPCSCRWYLDSSTRYLVSFKARPVLRPGTAYPPAAHYLLFSPPLSLFVINFIIYQLSRFNPYKPCLTVPYTLQYSTVQYRTCSRNKASATDCYICSTTGSPLATVPTYSAVCCILTPLRRGDASFCINRYLGPTVSQDKTERDKTRPRTFALPCCVRSHHSSSISLTRLLVIAMSS